MAKFNYLAKAQDGSSRKGTVTASNSDTALSTLQSNGLIVISLQDANAQSVFSQDLEVFNRVTARELVIFSRILATFLEVQIPLVDAMAMLAEQNKKNKYFTSVLAQVITDLQDGNLLSEALSKHPKVFDRLYISMIRSGEASGGLQETLTYMADYLEDQYELNNKIKGALAYPIFVLLVFLVIGIGIAYFILPQLVDVLQSLGTDTELPWTTQLIIIGSNIIQNYIWFLLGGIIISLGGIWAFLRTEAGKKFSDTWKIRLPVFGSLFTKMYVARFSTNMKTLLQGGVPIIMALEISSDVVGNYVFEGIIKEAIVEIKGGAVMSKAFLNHPEFPQIASQIISVGEKTGKMNSVLETLARFYKREVDVIVDNLTTLIEPVMIVVLGIGVAIFVISILMPIYNVAGSI